MMQVLLAVEIVIAIFLVAVILMQRSEGGALGMGGGAGLGGLMSARGAGNLLTRLTAILAAAFIMVALGLAIIAGNRDDGTSVFDEDAAVVADQPVDAIGDLDEALPLDDVGAGDEDQPLADPDNDGGDDTSGQ